MAQYEVAPTPENSATAEAAAPVAKPGPGVEALQKLLASGKYDEQAVIAILDGHRGERDGIFALLQSTLGNGYVQQVVQAMDGLRASVARREIAAGDPSNPDSGFFVAGQAEQGARWRTADGSFVGRAGKEGLDTTYRLGEHDALHGVVDKHGEGSLAWERDGRNEGELYRSSEGGATELGIRRTDEVGGGALTYGARHRVDDTGASDGVAAEYKTPTTTVGGSIGLQDGHGVGELHGSHKLAGGGTVSGAAAIAREGDGQVESVRGSYADDRTTVNGSLAHHADGAVTGGLDGTYKLNPTTSLAGSIARDRDRTTYAASASEQLSPQLSLGQSLTHVSPDNGNPQTTLALSERYRSGDTIQSADLTFGRGERDYMSATGSLDTRLGPSLYAGAWGSYSKEADKQASASLGASLTFTPTEKTALTLAGIVDHSGAFETRLELDVFKSKLDGIGDIAEHKKDALVSLFLSYSKGRSGMLDDRFGAPQRSFGGGGGGDDGQVTAGFRIRF